MPLLGYQFPLAHVTSSSQGLSSTRGEEPENEVALTSVLSNVRTNGIHKYGKGVLNGIIFLDTTLVGTLANFCCTDITTLNWFNS